MPAFCDMKGRQYESVITISRSIKLRNELGVDLLQVGSQEFTEKLLDQETLIGALWIACEPSAVAMQVTPEEFGESLGGDSLDNAIHAFEEAILLFCRPPQRAALRKLMEKGAEVQELAMQRLNLTIDNLTPEAVLASMNTATDSQALSGSAPQT